jgi:hypothetical protein
LLKDRLPGSGADYAYSVLKQKLASLATINIEPILWVMLFNKACEQSIKELADRDGFAEGNAWNALIVALTNLAKKSGWPTGASKGAQKSKSGRHSHFTIFIDAMQNLLPEEARRYGHSLDSLAQGINLARSAARDVKAKA